MEKEKLVKNIQIIIGVVALIVGASGLGRLIETNTGFGWPQITYWILASLGIAIGILFTFLNFTQEK